jgi:hypothetical protein
LLNKPAVEFRSPRLFSGKLSALYSSGLAEERGWSERGWKLADYGRVRRALDDRQVLGEIIDYYWGHLHAKGFCSA